MRDTSWKRSTANSQFLILFIYGRTFPGKVDTQYYIPGVTLPKLYPRYDCMYVYLESVYCSNPWYQTNTTAPFLKKKSVPDKRTQTKIPKKKQVHSVYNSW